MSTRSTLPMRRPRRPASRHVAAACITNCTVSWRDERDRSRSSVTSQAGRQPVVGLGQGNARPATAQPVGRVVEQPQQKRLGGTHVVRRLIGGQIGHRDRIGRQLPPARRHVAHRIWPASRRRPRQGRQQVPRQPPRQVQDAARDDTVRPASQTGCPERERRIHRHQVGNAASRATGSSTTRIRANSYDA